MWKIFGNSTRYSPRKVCTLFSKATVPNVQMKNHSVRCKTDAKCAETTFSTRIAVPTDYEYILEFMRDNYFKSEPSIVNIGLANGDPPPLLVDLMHQQLKNGLSIITLNEDGCIVGAAVNAGMAPWDPERLREIAHCTDNKDVASLLTFFAKIAELPKLWETYDVTRVFECSSVAVDSRFQGAGIATKLIHDSWMLARDCGTKLFRIDCSSKYTAKIAQKFGWECVASVPYSSHVECGEFVFKHIKKPHDTMDIYIDLPLKPKGCK